VCGPQLRDELYPLDERGRPMLGETEPVFDAANVLRAGRDLYYLVSGSGNELGARWLQTTLSAIGGDHFAPYVSEVFERVVDSQIEFRHEQSSPTSPGTVILRGVGRSDWPARTFCASSAGAARPGGGRAEEPTAGAACDPLGPVSRT